MWSVAQQATEFRHSIGRLKYKDSSFKFILISLRSTSIKSLVKILWQIKLTIHNYIAKKHWKYLI